MPGHNQHVILRQIIDLNLPKGIDAFAMQQEISRLAEEKLAPAMDTLFDCFASREELIEIDRLEVDIGNLTLPEFYKTFVGKTIDSLEDKLLSVINYGTGEIHRSPAIGNQFDHWLFFLEKGHLPWNGVVTDEEEFHQVILTHLYVDQGDLERFRRLITTNPAALSRLVSQHSETFLVKFLETITRHPQKKLPGYRKEVRKLVTRTIVSRKDGFFFTDNRLFYQSFWEWCIRDIFSLQQSKTETESVVIDFIQNLINSRNLTVRKGESSLQQAFVQKLKADSKSFPLLCYITNQIETLQTTSPTHPDFLPSDHPVTGTAPKEKDLQINTREEEVDEKEGIELPGEIHRGKQLLQQSDPELLVSDNLNPFKQGNPEPEKKNNLKTENIPANQQKNLQHFRQDDLESYQPEQSLTNLQINEQQIQWDNPETVQPDIQQTIQRESPDTIEQENLQSLQQISEPPFHPENQETNQQNIQIPFPGKNPPPFQRESTERSQQENQGTNQQKIQPQSQRENPPILQRESTKRSQHEHQGTTEQKTQPLSQRESPSTLQQKSTELPQQENTYLPQQESQRRLKQLQSENDRQNIPETVVHKNLIEIRPDLNDAAWPEKTKKKSDIPVGNAWYVRHAGVVLLHTFLVRFFGQCRLLNVNEFVDDLARHKAVHLLQFLASGETGLPEYDLVLPKFLCGVPFEEPVIRKIRITKKESAESEDLLRAAISHWSKLGNSSPAALREGFLQREGKLEKRQQGWYLVVEQKSIDILLDYLPWNLRMVKLPWMPELLRVEWA